jgi:release factor glutamine methyltransferase
MKLSTATEILRDAGIEDPRREARLIFSAFSGMEIAALCVGDAQCDLPILEDAVRRRSEREPLQYIIGEVDFYRERYRVTPDCLIPRSDTEILVDEAVKMIPDGARFADLCTGSGCIALSVLNNTKSTTAVAVDISKGALRVAKENADRLSLSGRVDFIEKDVLAGAIEGKYFAILSNPPYVTAKAYESLMPEIYFEPDIAFLGGEDGLDFYRGILKAYENSLEDGGFFGFEIGYDQADAISALAAEHSMAAEIIKDLSGNPRVAILKK